MSKFWNRFALLDNFTAYLANLIAGIAFLCAGCGFGFYLGQLVAGSRVVCHIL